MAFNEDLSDWDAFLRDWPIERLRSMTLAEYATVGDKQCFTYLVERGLDGYGGMRGGTALKFGIYAHRSGESDEKRQENVTYSTNYAWYSRFGADEGSVFRKVRDEVVAIVEAASRGDFSSLDTSSGDGLLWPVYRSKLAFLYQDRSNPRLTAVLSPPSLRKFLGLPANDRTLPTQLHARVLQQRQPNESLMSFGERVWDAVKPPSEYLVTLTQGAITAPNNYLPLHDLPNSPFPKEMIGDDSGAHPGKSAMFRTDTGETFHSDIRSSSGKSGRLRTRMGSYFQAINPTAGDQVRIEALDDGSYQLTHVPKAAPSAASSTLPVAETTSSKSDMTSKEPLNQILFGPPGTGKTFRTIDKALEILDPEFLRNHGAREDRKKRFDELAKDGLIQFVTFHQSFSYEDFVEGISAISTEDGQLRYEPKEGVFKKICNAARSNSPIAKSSGIRPDCTIWKLSIDGTASRSPSRDYCFKNNEARIGWGKTGDLSNSDLEENEYYKSLGSKVKSTLQYFSAEAVTGDVILCIGSNETIQAIGVVSGPYFYDEAGRRDVYDDYNHALPVRWLKTGMNLNILEVNGGNVLGPPTMYRLGRLQWPAIEALLTKNGISLSEEPETPKQPDASFKQPHVLIIDEINRGNISRIFGELISLIEESKREGALEQLTITLPYTRDQFTVPKNVYIIGTMNTADRSLAGLDIALRRRFVFEEMPPKPDLLGTVDGIDLRKLLTTMNQRIEVLLGRDYLLGHAYFIGIKSVAELKDVFQRQVLPLLQEYFFEDWEKIALVLNDHRKAADHRFLSQPGNDLQTLFGKEGVANSNPRWNLNTEAFIEPESYLGIYSAAGPAP